MKLLQRCHLLIIIAVILCLVPCHLFADDVPAEARRLAIQGKRAEALQLLIRRLTIEPDDVDARIIYGVILSWEGQYDKAREQLSRALADSPRNGDAQQALASVELWTDHPAKAEDLLQPLVKARPNDTDILYAHARALKDLNRRTEALAVLDRLLEIDPSHHDAFNLRAGLNEGVQLWDASVRFSREWFSDGIGGRNETQLSLKRSTHLGSLIGRYSNANRFASFGNQLEMDFYPGIRKGTYALLNVGFSPEAVLYPRYRTGGDIYQSLGKGFEATAGYRRLGFTTPVNVYTVALSKYYGAWLFSGRGYFTPSTSGTSKSIQLSGRRYLKDAKSYLDFSFGHGSTPGEIRSAIDLAVLRATSFSTSLEKTAGRHWAFSGSLGIGHEDRPNRPAVYHNIVSFSAFFRF